MTDSAKEAESDQEQQEGRAFRYYFVRRDGSVVTQVPESDEQMSVMFETQANGGGLVSLVNVKRADGGLDQWVGLGPLGEPFGMDFSTRTEGGVLVIKVSGQTVKSYGPAGWLELDVDSAIKFVDDDEVTISEGER